MILDETPTLTAGWQKEGVRLLLAPRGAGEVCHGLSERKEHLSSLVDLGSFSELVSLVGALGLGCHGYTGFNSEGKWPPLGHEALSY